MILFTIAWCLALGLIIKDHLEKQLNSILKKYEAEYAKNTASIVLNVLQIVFKSCGVFGPGDYSSAKKAPQWIISRNDPNRFSQLGRK